VRVEWSDEALTDRAAIVDYLLPRNPHAAKRILHHHHLHQTHNHHVLASPTSSPSKRQKSNSSSKESSSSSRSSAIPAASVSTATSSSQSARAGAGAASSNSNSKPPSSVCQSGNSKFFNLHEKIRDLYLQLLSNDLNYFAETGVSVEPIKSGNLM